jgi:hypothetical protein
MHLSKMNQVNQEITLRKQANYRRSAGMPFKCYYPRIPQGNPMRTDGSLPKKVPSGTIHIISPQFIACGKAGNKKSLQAQQLINIPNSFLSKSTFHLGKIPSLQYKSCPMALAF